VLGHFFEGVQSATPTKIIQSSSLHTGQLHGQEYLFEIEKAAVTSKLRSWWYTTQVAIAVKVLEVVAEITLKLWYVSH
jgi:hypothetical protein